MKFRKFLPVFLFSSLFVAGCCQDHVKPVAKEVVVAKPVPKPTPPPKPVLKDSDKDGVYDNKDACPNTPIGAEVEARGCWVLKGVHFENNSADLTITSHAILDKAVNVLAINPKVKILVEGHTDGKGDAAYNEALSQKRADSVKAYFVGKGISGDRLATKGYGLTHPIASNETPEGRALNRRVVLTAQ